MELGLLFLAIVVFSWWYDNLCVCAFETHKKSNVGLSTTKDSIKKDGNWNIQ